MHPKEEKVKPACTYACIDTCFYVRRKSTEFLYLHTEEFQPREGRDAYIEKKQCTMASLIGSKLAKISYDVSLANSRAPGVRFVLVSSM